MTTCSDMVGVALIPRLECLAAGHRTGLGYADQARLAVELEEQAALALVVRQGTPFDLDDERLARLDLDRDLLVVLQPVEVSWRRK